MTLGSTQPLTEMSNRNISWQVNVAGKGGRCLGLTNLPLHVLIVLKSGNLNPLETSGPVQACIGFALPFYHSAPLRKNFIIPGDILSKHFNVCLLYTNICTNKSVYNKHLLFIMFIGPCNIMKVEE